MRGDKKIKQTDGRQDNNYWLQLGLKMFAESTGWIVIPVVGALFLGRWLDNKYGTEPLYFLAITLMAFIISSIGIGINGVKYIKMIEKDEAGKKKKTSPEGFRAKETGTDKKKENNN
jgi:F0F1-type ATP synthase assembly protein I